MHESLVRIKNLNRKSSSLYQYIYNDDGISFQIDVPNDFPWRKCMLDYNGVAATSECVLKRKIIKINRKFMFDQIRHVLFSV